MTQMTETLITINEYAKLFGITRRTVHRKLSTKRLKAFRSPNNKHWYIAVDLEKVGRIKGKEEKQAIK